jgi:hypothetical protein
MITAKSLYVMVSDTTASLNPEYNEGPINEPITPSHNGSKGSRLPDGQNNPRRRR